ncbi:MAG: hypothetical protein A2521_08440 [Deltaproteobacteria bacterium RIFOXYD12_FULL_57_12]|nr:MAG: hypothetical protein A2521_08440 [Deltaproteobacteria bacterium RIFOXYD12_FULL_57_12]
MKTKPILILAFIVFFPNLSHSTPEEFILNQTSICRDFIHDKSNQMKKFPYNDLAGTALMFTACSKPEIMNNLTTQEKYFINELARKIKDAKKELSENQLERVKQKEDIVNNNWENLKNSKEPQDLSSLSEQGKKELDQNLKSIWSKMCKALANNNIELAINYFADRSKEAFKRHFLTLRPAERLKIAQENQIVFANISGGSVNYHLITTRDGQRYSFQLTFIQDMRGEWKILTF